MDGEKETAHPEVRCAHIFLDPKRLPEDVVLFWQIYVRYARHRLLLADWGKPDDREMIRELVKDMKFISTQVVPTVRR